VSSRRPVVYAFTPSSIILDRLTDPKTAGFEWQKGCSPQGLVASNAPTWGVGLSRFIPVQKDQARFAASPRTIDDGVEHLPCVHGFSDLSAEDEVEIFPGHDGVHKLVRDPDGKVEIRQSPSTLFRAMNSMMSGWSTPEDPHVGPPPDTPLFQHIGRVS